MKSGRIRDFLLGVGFCAVIAGAGGTALAAGGLVTLNDVRMGGINIIVDGQTINPKDANGKAVSPLIYNGTTYLPVRAVADAVGKSVYWDGPTYTVYIGEMNGVLSYPTVMLKDMTSIGNIPYVSKELTDNYGNSYGSALYHNSSYRDATFEYLLNMKYSRLKGTLYVPEGTTSDQTTVITIEADGKQIYSSPVMTKTSTPVNFDVNITGCNDLKIFMPANSLYLHIGDAGFYQ